MPNTFYLDPISGNDANDGTSFANRWKTFELGALAARTAPGDTIRIIASPNPTLVGDAEWTHDSNVITLDAAVTAVITDCETTWTQSANVTCTRSTAAHKEGAYYCRTAIATAFATGKASYFATGTLDLSAYQKVSFWFRTSSAIADATTIYVCLCSDTAGATPVHSMAIPAIAATGWRPMVFDLATNLSNSIKSIAIYQNTDRASINIDLDHVIACKASASADALTLLSLIGKRWNFSWAPATSYSVGNIVRPTQPNRNGLVYKMTSAGSGDSGGSEPTWPIDIGLEVLDNGRTWECVDFEDTWWAIKSIVGTAVTLDFAPVSGASVTDCGYWGASETVATYKREGLYLPGSGSTPVLGATQELGTFADRYTYSGGWDRTAMSVQDGETWLDCVTGAGLGIRANQGFQTFTNLGVVRADIGFQLGNYARFSSCHANSCDTFGFRLPSSGDVVGCSANKNGSAGADLGSFYGSIKRSGFNCSSPDAANGMGWSGMDADQTNCVMQLIAMHHNYYGCISAGGYSGVVDRLYASSATHSGDVVYGASSNADRYLTNPVIEAGMGIAPGSGQVTYVHNLNRVDHDHYIIFHEIGGCQIVPDAFQRHTDLGYSWRFESYSLASGPESPMYLRVAQVLCEANVAKNIWIWTRRSSVSIFGRLQLRGGQLTGLSMDLNVACEPTINTWERSNPLTFTPTETGVVEIRFLVWQTGIYPSLLFWIDDLEVV